MPRLNNVEAREAEKAAEDSAKAFEPVPEGMYVVRLKEVEASDKVGDSGYSYWLWKYEVLDDAYSGKPLTHITSLSPKARFSIGGAFRAFGVPADTHTDDLLGQKVLARVSVSPISKGPRQGQLQNRIEEVVPYDDKDETTSALDEDF